jgi:alkanesulfonate monooxygenase SsuD/methylene tetrahydromethanopterin reductase-like flavin-dependent oxidoreductase (luciferase family)
VPLKVGLFFDLRNPPGWRRPWAEHYRRTLDRIVEVDRLGGDAVWLTEHHGWEDGYLSQPLAFAAAIAARTERIRIGAGITLAPLRHPAHIAEEAALVDVISDGRLELGLGAGWSRPEFDLFGVDFQSRFSLTDAAVTAIRQLVADRLVTPPPVQDPLPLWLGYQSPKGAYRAGAMSVGLLSLDPALREPYHQGLREGGHDAAAARMGGLVNIVLADDPEAARERILPYYAYQFNSYRRARRSSSGEDPGPDLEITELRTIEAGSGRWPSGPGLSVYTPEDAAAAIGERVDGLPVEHVYMWASIAGMPDDLVDRHVELVCTRLRALLQDAGQPVGGQ